MKQNNLIENAGCDWLTMTWKATEPNIDNVSGTIYERLEELQQGGNQAKETKVMQYQGIRAGKLFWGRDDTHFYCQATSSEANETAKRIIRERVGGKATRCDLQITASYPERAETFFEELRNRIGGLNTSGEKRRKQVGAYYFAPGRDTGISLGAGSNERNFRAYSAREGGHPDASENAVRFELQLRQARARQAWEIMENADSLENLSLRVVANEVRALGLEEPWLHITECERLPPITNHRDVETAFRWYRSQIFPSFAKTIASGHGERLLEELLQAVTDAYVKSQQPAALELPAYKRLFGEINNGRKVIQNPVLQEPKRRLKRVGMVE